MLLYFARGEACLTITISSLIGDIRDGPEKVLALTEVQFYTVIIVIANIFVHCIEARARARQPPFRAQMMTVVINCRSRLKYDRLRNPSPARRPSSATAILQRHARRAHQRAARFPGLRDTLREWTEVGALVPVPAHDNTREAAPFAPLERCAWRGCACSALRPAHRLKACTRCWIAAYCCVACQERCGCARVCWAVALSFVARC